MELGVLRVAGNMAGMIGDVQVINLKDIVSIACGGNMAGMQWEELLFKNNVTVSIAGEGNHGGYGGIDAGGQAQRNGAYCGWRVTWRVCFGSMLMFKHNGTGRIEGGGEHVRHAWGCAGINA